MRLAVYTHYYHPEIGAPSARIGDISNEWREAGHDVHVVTCFPNHPTGVVYPGYALERYRHQLLGGVQVHRNWTYVTPNKGIFKKTLGHASLWPSARIFTAPRLPKPDCAIGTSPTFFAAMAARSCARRHGVPFIMEVRDLWPAIFADLGIVRNRLVLWLLRRWEMNLYRSANRIVTVTESFRANLISRGIAPERVVTITNGADIDFWRRVPEEGAALRRKLGLAESFVVLYIGAHGVSQGLESVLNAAARCSNDSRIKFVFVGEGADREKLRRDAVNRQLTNVQFMDPVDRAGVRAYYSAADVCLVPLRKLPLFDSFIPSKMFEIMSSGRPIVGSVSGEAKAILERSSAAEIVAPEDSEAMASALRGLCDKPWRLESMGLAGRKFVMKDFSRAGLAKRYLGVAQEAIAGHRNGL